MPYSKYHASKAKCKQGHVHDSIKEARRCNELHMLLNAGEISDLQIQKKFVLIPTQRESCSETYSKGRKKGSRKPGKVIEKECAYIADFCYTDGSGKLVVEDTKGMKTKEYIIKRKLMLHECGIRIKEV